MSFDNVKYILESSLSSLFNKLASSNNAKIITTLTNEITDAETNVEEVRLASTVTFASCGDLDLHGKTFGVSRNFGEEDETYRQRLLKSYDKNNVTFNNLNKLVTDYSQGTIKAYQYFYDRWWLGGQYWPAPVTELVNTITGTTVRASSGIMANSVPECWLGTDLAKTGTNYSSGSSFTNDVSGSLVTLSTAVSGAGVPVRLIYTPTEIVSANYDYDFVPHSFLNVDTISRHRLVSNNFILVNSTPNNIQIRTNLLPGYKVYISYFDNDVGTTYNWQAVVGNDQILTIDETKRTDNSIVDEYSLPTNLNQIDTVYEIGNVNGVYLATDTRHELVNYSTSDNYIGNTITLDTPLPFKTGVITSYNRYHIKNYSNLNFSQFIKTGYEDLRFTIEFDIWQTFSKYGDFKYGQKRWGELLNPTDVIVGELLDNAKAAGIQANLIIMINEVRYGDTMAIYGEVFYGAGYVS